MPKQPAFPGFRDAMKKKVTRREQFLTDMDAVVPWGRLLALIEPHYPKVGPKGGRPPMALETMLRVYFLQNWYALSDPMAEETLYDSEAMRRFAGIELGDDRIPDETTILNFRHLLERHGLTQAIFADVNAHLADKGITLRSGTLVDATIIGAGLGTRLANSIRLASFPKSGESLNAAALVWSNAPVIVGAHDTGPLIRSKNGFWLAIPTPAAGKSTRGGRITPGEWERRSGLRLRFIYRRRGPSLLVAEGRLNTKGRAVASRSKSGRGLITAPIFLLVPQVKLPKRLDLARDAERAHGAVPGLIVANWVEGQLG